MPCALEAVDLRRAFVPRFVDSWSAPYLDCMRVLVVSEEPVTTSRTKERGRRTGVEAALARLGHEGSE